MSRLARTIIIVSLLSIALFSTATLHFKSQSQVQVPPGLRAQRDTWTPLMDVLKDKRPRVTDEQLAKMKACANWRKRAIGIISTTSGRAKTGGPETSP